MLPLIWRAIIAILDWRTVLGFIKGKATIDAVFISNLRDETDRLRYLGWWVSKDGHFNANRFWFKGVSGRVRVINSTSADIFTLKGRKKAQSQFISAVEWAEKRGARVVLFAATTKRLFTQEQMEQLKSDFPNIIFTIGDNGTGLSLQEDTILAFSMSGIKNNSRVAVLGPSGFLGGIMTRFLKESGYQVVGLGSDKARLDKVSESVGIEVCMDFSGLGEVASVIACTHSSSATLDPSIIDKIRKINEKLLIIDVAEPKNLSEDEYKHCEDRVILLHAGDPYSKDLKYVGGFFSYRMLRLSKGVVFGCFAEALAIAHHLKYSRQDVDEIKSTNWLTVSDCNIEVVKKLFNNNFVTGKPRCFTRKIKSWHRMLPSI